MSEDLPQLESPSDMGDRAVKLWLSPSDLAFRMEPKLNTLVEWQKQTSPPVDSAAQWERVASYLKEISGQVWTSTDDFEPPTNASTTKLLSTIDLLLKRQIYRPDAVTPMGDGGICFEWEVNKNRFSIESDCDGKISIVEYRDALGQAAVTSF